MQLPSAPAFRLIVYAHATGGQNRLALTAAVGHTRELQQLAQADHLAEDLNVARHDATVAVPSAPYWTRGRGGAARGGALC